VKALVKAAAEPGLVYIDVAAVGTTC
jgi:hypothetical protein